MNRFRERNVEHVMTVVAKDNGTPSKRNYARLRVAVEDSNNHAPQWSHRLIQGYVLESADRGSTVLNLLATDKDRGDNAQIRYSILSGTFCYGLLFTGWRHLILNTLPAAMGFRSVNPSKTNAFKIKVRLYFLNQLSIDSPYDLGFKQAISGYNILGFLFSDFNWLVSNL